MNARQHKFGIGGNARRVEDEALVRDADATPQTSMPTAICPHIFLRGDHRCAEIRAVDTSLARKMDGVHLIWTGADVEGFMPVEARAPVQEEAAFREKPLSADLPGQGPERGRCRAKVADQAEYRTSPLYTPAERAALDLAAAGARVPVGDVQAAFAAAWTYFNEDELIEIVSLVALFGWFNRWNSMIGTDLEETPKEFAIGSPGSAR